MAATRFVLGLTLLAAAAACGSGSSSPTAPIRNTTVEGPASSRLAIDARTPMGTLGLAAVQIREEGLPYWVPIIQAAPVIAPVESKLVVGGSYTVVTPDGLASETLRADTAVYVKYGCDENTAEIIPLDGPWTTPGVVWIIPDPVPATWAPLGEPLTATETTRDRRHWTAGPLALTLDRTDDSHATFTIRDNGAAAHHERAERYLMAGAGDSPIDLTADRWPGIPKPVAVFRFAADGPYLVVLDRSGYEGVTFETLLVGAGDVRKVESMSFSLYYCAF